MRLMKILGALVGLGGFVLLALVAVTSISGQARTTERRLPPIDWPGGVVEIGASVRTAEPDEPRRGVVVDEVVRDGPADTAGVRRSDVVVEFDGERVHSARQFSRLVQEAVPGRAVIVTIVRDGQKMDVQMT